jgi:hypothetical protein
MKYLKILHRVCFCVCAVECKNKALITSKYHLESTVSSKKEKTYQIIDNQHIDRKRKYSVITFLCS